MYIELCIGENSYEYLRKFRACWTFYSQQNLVIGGVMLAADYSQLELRILAHLSGDKKLKNILNSGGDVFKTIASQWKGVEVAHVTPTDRAQAKQVITSCGWGGYYNIVIIMSMHTYLFKIFVDK